MVESAFDEKDEKPEPEPPGYVDSLLGYGQKAPRAKKDPILRETPAPAPASDTPIYDSVFGPPAPGGEPTGSYFDPLGVFSAPAPAPAPDAVARPPPAVLTHRDRASNRTTDRWNYAQFDKSAAETPPPDPPKPRPPKQKIPTVVLDPIT